MNTAGPSDEIRVSVALVTRNRPDSLRRCLESLRAQSVQPFEVVVSDDSDPASADATHAVADEFGCRYMTGPRRGLYANRNAAALACTGTHIRTMDDDHTFPPGHFAQCLAAVESDPRAVWTTGEVSFIDGNFFARNETATQLHPSGVGGPVSDPDDNWAIADGSTIYPAEIFKRGLRMVEEFSYGSSYLEFGAYLSQCGWRGRCVRGALVEHHADAATLARCDNLAGVQSRLFASIAFNLFFRPSAFRLLKYGLANLRSGGFRPELLRSAGPLLQKVRQRWRPVMAVKRRGESH